MNQLTKLLQQFDLAEGFTETPLPGIRLFKCCSHQPRVPLTYAPGICVVAQGHKVGHVGDRSFRYDPENYLLISVTMPFECETFATPEDPLYGLYIDVDITLLNDVISQLDTDEIADSTAITDTTLPLGIGPAPLDMYMRDALCRLVRALASDTETRILGPGLMREILLRALTGPQGAALHALAARKSQFARVAETLRLMQADYAADLDVEFLARHAHMSPSAFHRAFKDVTNESPLQYLKKIRLNKARDLIVLDGLKAYMAAERVGYESASQFSREFKRHFGLSPSAILRG